MCTSCRVVEWCCYAFWMLFCDLSPSIWRCGRSSFENSTEVERSDHDLIQPWARYARTRLLFAAAFTPPESKCEQSSLSPTVASVNAEESDVEEDAAESVVSGTELMTWDSFQEAQVGREDLTVSNRHFHETRSYSPEELLQLAETHHEAGEHRKAVTMLNQLLELGQLTQVATSFVLNRKGIYLLAAGDVAGAQESYELASWGGQQNKHSLFNLALLLHHHIFPQRPADFWVLSRAIELYRSALGRIPSSPSATNLRSNHHQLSAHYQAHGTTSGSSEREADIERANRETIQHDGEIGGPIDKTMVSIELATALSQSGRPDEAVAELEFTLEHTWGFKTTHPRKRSANRQRVMNMGTEMGGTARDVAALWDRLASVRSNVGDSRGAVAAAKMAVELVKNEPVLYHNLGTVLQKSGLLAEAEEAWRSAVALEPGMTHSLSSLGHLEGARGNITGALELYESSLAILSARDQGDSSPGRGSAFLGSKNGVSTARFLVATAVVPFLYDSPSHILQVRENFGHGLDRLLDEPNGALHMVVDNPVETVGSGSLGYYIIYQGFEDLDIRRKLAKAYWKFAPSLRYCASFLEDEDEETRSFHRTNHRAATAQNSSTLLTRLSHLSGIRMDGYQGQVATLRGKLRDGDSANSLPQHSSPSPSVLPVAAKATFESQSHLNGASSFEMGKIGVGVRVPCRRRRLRVGFLSAFFFQHSVGMLTEGVVTRLDRLRFETTAIFLQPHPMSAGEGGGGFGSNNNVGEEGGDQVYRAVRRETEHVLDIPSSSPTACRHSIASLELDVLVFTEIGMNPESYFLSFARLARRSVLFWGHAVTSGVSAFDAMSVLPLGSQSVDAAGPPWNFTKSQRVGGVDYFVSSWLFEDNELGRLAQRKYSERLYLMKGLTTRFVRPPPPEPDAVTRDSLGIPPSSDSILLLGTEYALKIGDDDEEAALYGGAKACDALYLVPQTLYKLHPDFDRLVAGVLKRDPSGCVMFIRAFELALTERLTKRLMATLRSEGVVGPERVIFVRRLGFHEFSGLLALADVVLDPFPVGGGRSSLEVFAVGTPIVMLYNRTSVLQLTYAMYATMGLEGEIADITNSNTPVSLVTYSEQQYILSAVTLATDAELNAQTRERILARNYRLYEQDSVVVEWEEFLEGIAVAPRPPPAAKRYDPAVDAANFSGLLPWCSSGTGDPGDDGQVDTEAPDGAISGNFYNNGAESPWGSMQKYSESTSARSERKEAKFKGGQGEFSPEFSTEPFASRSSNDSTNPPGRTWGQLFNRTPISTDWDWSAGATKLAQGSHLAASSAGPAGAADRSRNLLYAVDFSVASTYKGGPPRRLRAELFEGDDPREEARKLMKLGGLDFLQYRWVELVLCRAVGRLNREVVWSNYVQIDDGPSLLLEIRQGDDLYQVARWHCRRHSLGFKGARALSEQLEQEIPQHQYPSWIASRAEDRALLSSKQKKRRYPTGYIFSRLDFSLRPENMSRRIDPHATADERSTRPRAGGILEEREDEGRAATEWDYDGCITLAITTCKRLREFLGTVDGLQALLGPLPVDGDRPRQGTLKSERAVILPRVCRVIVVDDGSSSEDRRVMMSAHPEFTYVFKSKRDEKGHAGSMNIIASMTQTRYLLYIEDDWWPVENEPLQPQSRERGFLWRAMEVLRNSPDGVAQVLINDQSSRSCAHGDVTACPRELQGIAGWPRFTPAIEAFNECNAITNLSDPSARLGTTDLLYRRGKSTHRGDPCESSRTHGVDTPKNFVGRHDSAGQGRVEYRLHEFGLMYPSQDFTYWPGFSCNPALWDLARLNVAYRRHHSGGLWFDSTNTRFEQAMSMELFDGGVTIAYLPDLTFRHVGDKHSAYKANGMHRPWD